MTAPVDTYTVASGQPIYGGKAAPSVVPAFLSVATIGTLTDTGVNTGEWATLPFALELHGSGGQNYTTGQKFRASVDGYMAAPGTSTLVNNEYDSHSTFGFSLCISYSRDRINLRPIDYWYNDTGNSHESLHMGFVRGDGRLHLIEERRYDALLEWADKTITQVDMNRRVLTGGSMGGWGTASYGIRRYDKFAALYPDRPRWNGGKSTFALAQWETSTQTVTYTKTTAPLLADEDGGGSSWDYCDMVAYVANTANKVRWIGWCVGRQDGFATFEEQIAMVNALRSAKRGFAFYWNNGDHATGSQMVQITQSYPMNLFRRDKGYPLFTEHSLDKDPTVDLIGGINIGLSFRNVVESATGWSCEVTSVLSACTVKTEPISDVFKASVAKKLVTIPAANTWVPVTFTA